ncbi:MAG: hypothetical protein QOH99_948 [Frankiaceae bacterium]|nr:hypothetical protein [Frankiaceae bacterium]
MPEVSLDFPREWIEFPDPANDDEIFRCDLTWLTSSWHCIFAAGCKGVDATRPNDGCCNHGAYFTDADDEKRVRAYTEQLTPELWENHREGRKGIATTLREEDEDGVIEKRRRTRIVNGSCIYFNSAEFPGGMGCALHHLAGKLDVHFMETKPEVCWQVPVRRAFDTRTYADGHEVLVTTITEFDRRSWGEGGHDFDWWCTGAPEAHGAREQVWQSYAAELTDLMGPLGYAALVKFCVKRNKSAKPNAVHPATKKAASPGYRKLLPLVF